MSSPYLVVPIEVQAMVLANPETTLIRGQMNYSNLTTSFSDPAPSPLQESTGFVTAATEGVYLTWTLPAALRQGVRQPDGSLQFPIVPNRWLVCRLFPGSTASTPSFWIVQSDFLDPSLGTSAYVSPTAATLTPVTIGRAVAITSGAPWQEPQNPPAPFLQAVAESNPYFAAWQPFNQNVFSFFDPLVSDNVAAGSISYYVVGWYADPQSDILAGWPVTGDPASFLAGLNWTETAVGTQPAGPVQSIYQGAAFGVTWNPGGQAYSPNGGGTSVVAVGNTSMDGIVAMAQTALGNSTNPTPAYAAEVLEAFIYDVLPSLGIPGGESQVEEQVRQHWYQSAPDGLHYVIVDAPSQPGTTPAPPTPGELAIETAWLTVLNSNQAMVNSLERQQTGLQRRLFELWWKQQWASQVYYNQQDDYPWNTSAQQFTQAIGTLSTELTVVEDALALFSAQVPQATDTVTLQQAIANFAALHDLPATRLLKAKSGKRFWTPTDPVVVSNTSATPVQPATGALDCRWLSQLVTSTTAPAPPAVPSTNLPAPVVSLFNELFLLDPSNGTPPAPGTGSVLPAILPPTPWAQPWQPLFLDWEIMWYDIPYASWEFDGQDYFLPAQVAPAQIQQKTFLGRTVLTPKPTFDLNSSLQTYIQNFPNSALIPTLEAIQTEIGSWSLQSQRLSGLTTQIAGWSAVATQFPESTSLRALIGAGARMPPNPQQATPEPPVPASTFEGMRAGQFFVNQLAIVDTWGQVLSVVNPPSLSQAPTVPGTDAIFIPETGYGVTPTNSIAFNPVSPNPNSFVELPPRILQPARLNFDLTPQHSGNPILGWILPNHLDSSLAVYGPDGDGYGELILGVNARNQPAIDWLPAPGSPVLTIPSSSASQPALLGFLAGLVTAGAPALSDFLHAVDETLWTVDPLGARADTFLSVLAGRPLAVVAATLSLELQSSPWRDPDWPYTFSNPPVDPLFLSHQFPVRLGDLGYREDGLLGYFTSGIYSSFNTCHLPSSIASDYLQLIGPAQGATAANFVTLQFGADGPGTPAQLTMIVDPRGSVHAQCGLVPVIEVALASEWVNSALAKMQLSFRVGPALVGAGYAPPPGQGPPAPGILMPRPAERKGTWSWQELDSQGNWDELALLPVDATATLGDTPPTLREGRLTLTGGLAD